MISNPHQFDYEMKEQKEKDGRNGKKKKNLQYDEKERNIGYYFSPTSFFPPMPKVYGNTPPTPKLQPTPRFRSTPKFYGPTPPTLSHHPHHHV